MKVHLGNDGLIHRCKAKQIRYMAYTPCFELQWHKCLALSRCASSLTNHRLWQQLGQPLPSGKGIIQTDIVYYNYVTIARFMFSTLIKYRHVYILTHLSSLIIEQMILNYHSATVQKCWLYTHLIFRARPWHWLKYFTTSPEVKNEFGVYIHNFIPTYTLMQI